MVTELVGHHVVNVRPAKPGRSQSYSTHIASAAASLSALTEMSFAAGWW